MTGIMMLADPDWFSFHERNSTQGRAIYYARPIKKTKREPLDPLFLVRPGKIPRCVVGVGLIQDQAIIDQDRAWETYGTCLGANTEAEWRTQASEVLENSRRKY